MFGRRKSKHDSSIWVAHMVARHGDYQTRLRHNLLEARVVAFETSPRRVIPRNAFKNALLATRRLVGSISELRRGAKEDWHFSALRTLEEKLKASRHCALMRLEDISIAQDVFVLISHFLGLNSVPGKPEPSEDKTSESEGEQPTFGMKRRQSVASIIRGKRFKSERKSTFAKSTSAFLTRSMSVKRTGFDVRSKSCVTSSELDFEFVDDSPRAS